MLFAIKMTRIIKININEENHHHRTAHHHLDDGASATENSCVGTPRH